jgi:hypothetical protein
MRPTLTQPSPAPKHLRLDGRNFWQEMVRDYAIDDTAGLSLLSRAAECVDRMAAARASIAEHGELLNGGAGPRLNPACRLERESRDGFFAAMRALHIDIQPPAATSGRPPGTFNKTRPAL